MKNFNKILQWVVLIAAIALLIFYFRNNHRVYDRAKIIEMKHVVSEDAKTGNQKTGQDYCPIKGMRNADRLIFSNDGLIFVTRNYYNSFEEN
jgi:hypothetical protein